MCQHQTCLKRCLCKQCQHLAMSSSAFFLFNWNSSCLEPLLYGLQTVTSVLSWTDTRHCLDHASLKCRPQKHKQPLRRKNTFKQPLRHIHTFKQPLRHIHTFKQPLRRIHTFKQTLRRIHTFKQPLRRKNTFKQPLRRKKHIQIAFTPQKTHSNSLYAA